MGNLDAARTAWPLTAMNRLRSTLWGLWSDLTCDNLWQRIVKFSIATIVTIIVVLVPEVVVYFPTTAFLGPLTTIFAHAGQRMGLMFEGLLMLIFGAATGTAWATLGIWLSSFVVEDNVEAAYAIRALFLLCAVLYHGYIRSSSPRLIIFVLFQLVSSTIILTGPATEVSQDVVIPVAFPILIGAATVVVCNLLIFPELSCNHLANTTVIAIAETSDVLNRSVTWFLRTSDGPMGLHDDIEIIPSRHSAAKSHCFAKRADQPVNTKTYRWYERFLPAFQNPFRSADQQESPIKSGSQTEVTSLAALTDSKAKLRTKVQTCRAAQSEVNLEVSIGPLPPRGLKPISTRAMKGLVHNVIALIGSCENKFVLLGDDGGEDEDGNLETSSACTSKKGAHSSRYLTPADAISVASGLLEGSQPGASRSSLSLLEDPLKMLQLVKPLREVEAGDPEVLEGIADRIRDPSLELMKATKQASRCVTRSLSYSFGLKKLPNKSLTPKSISLEEMDASIDVFVDAIDKFDQRSTAEMEMAISTEDGQIDFMPRMETFLVSSFLLSLRQAAVHLLQMMRHARTLVEKRQASRFRWNIHAPVLSGWRTWLSTGGESDAMVLPKTARRKGRTGQETQAQKEEAMEEDEEEAADAELEKPSTLQGADEEKVLEDKKATTQPPSSTAERDKPPKSKKRGQKKRGEMRTVSGVRTRAADAFESLQNSDDGIYAAKLAVGFFIVTWPAFVSSWHEWYVTIRAVWAPLQLILIFEVAIGTSLFVFVIRMVGVIFGCLVGYLAYEVGDGNKVVLVVILALGVVPSVYIQLGTKYVKTGMVAIVSSTSVALATVNAGNPAYENFYLRLVTFFIGGTVGLLVEMTLYPARARDRMVESLSASIKQMTTMQSAVAVGVDDPTKVNLQSVKLQHRFERSREKAQGALAAAETFLPFCLTEPRLKGSFRPLHPVYREIVYVLHQIVERMDNMLQLRRAYGSSVLEELNPEVHAYRRAVAGSVALALFAVDEALTTRMPLPQFLPSARVAMLRLVNRVKEVLEAKTRGQRSDEDDDKDEDETEERIARTRRQPSSGAVAGADAAHEPGERRDERIAEHHKYLSWNANAAGLLEIIEYLEELVELAKLLVGVNAFRSGMLERPTFRDYARRTKGTKEDLSAREMDGANDDDDDNSEDNGDGRQGNRGNEGDGGEDAAQNAVERGETADQVAELGRTGTETRSSGSSSPRDDKIPDRKTTRNDEIDVPISLQRVSTRRATVRKRNTSLVGGGKGKGREDAEW